MFIDDSVEDDVDLAVDLNDNIEITEVSDDYEYDETDMDEMEYDEAESDDSEEVVFE